MAQKLYVGNLSYQSTEDELRDLFSQYGEVQAVRLIVDRDTGRSRGFAFVEMEDGTAAIEALNGYDLGGRSLRVNEARERQDRGSGGGKRW